MSTTSHRPLHERVERVLETGDLRLVYGLGVPLLAVVAGCRPWRSPTQRGW
jgi:hypothetical protein